MDLGCQYFPTRLSLYFIISIELGCHYFSLKNQNSHYFFSISYTVISPDHNTLPRKVITVRLYNVSIIIASLLNKLRKNNLNWKYTDQKITEVPKNSNILHVFLIRRTTIEHWRSSVQLVHRTPLLNTSIQNITRNVPKQVWTRPVFSL
jgi:hypothetical protein